jgi:hypothetical protein
MSDQEERIEFHREEGRRHHEEIASLQDYFLKNIADPIFRKWLKEVFPDDADRILKSSSWTMTDPDDDPLRNKS